MDEVREGGAAELQVEDSGKSCYNESGSAIACCDFRKGRCTMDHPILLSLIIPTYNCGAFFRDSLERLLASRPAGFEIVLSDDGSVDDTRSVLKDFEGKYEDLTILYNEHHGVSVTRNTGLEAARGKYITFLDCDDCFHSGFLTEERLRFPEEADLYIFGMERQTLDGRRDQWLLEDRCYPDASHFADEYIRKHKLLVYSVANKLYKRSIVEGLGLRFEEGMQFGEDRLFNFRYLEACGKIITSSEIMQDYIQRSDVSLSNIYKPRYFETILALHQAKMDCVLRLSKGTSEQEKRAYRAYDLTNEIKLTIDRFSTFPLEKEESLRAINRVIFGKEESPAGLEDWYCSEQQKEAVLDGLRKRIMEAE